MSISAHNPYEEPESSTTRWVLIFVLLSLLAHAIIIAAIFLITRFMPVPKIVVPEPETTTLTLTQLPPQAAPPRKPIFIPTNPQANAQHKQQLVESANDHDLTSTSKTARNPDSIMPDVVGKEHASQFNNTPEVQAPQEPQVSSTPPTPKQAEPQKPTPPQPNPNQAKQPPPKPPQPAAKPLPPTPPQKAPPQLDANGLPVLPPLNAPTLAPPNSAAPALAPAPSPLQQAASSHGAVQPGSDNSPAAMATVFGKYKQRVYAAVGSRWYPKINNSLQLIGVGQVHVQYTIYSDGTVETKILDSGGSAMQMLLSISVNSIREAAPFDSFDKYPGLREEIIKAQGGDGNSYTDDFTFSVY
jgi:outer membrane biosynthesis protein TonB